MSLQQYWGKLSSGISSVLFNNKTFNILSTIDKHGYEKIFLSIFNDIFNDTNIRSFFLDQDIHLMTIGEFSKKISEVFPKLLNVSPFFRISKYQIIGFISEKWSENHKEFIELYQKTSDKKDELMSAYIRDFLSNLVLETIKEGLEHGKSFLQIDENTNTNTNTNTSSSFNDLINNKLEKINLTIDNYVSTYEHNTKSFFDLKNSIKEKQELSP